jgi:hypothetical protein
VQIVVEPKQELPFEIARGSEGGAAKRGGGPTMPVLFNPHPDCHRGPPRFGAQNALAIAFPRSVVEGRTDSELLSPEARF